MVSNKKFVSLQVNIRILRNVNIDNMNYYVKKASIIIAALIFLTGNRAWAQRTEAGFFLGGSFYMGDINKSKLFAQTNFAGGLIYRYNLNTYWAVKGNALYGKVEATDSKYGNIERNLSFRSNIFDFGLQMELNFMRYFTGSKTIYRFTPYLTGGVALFFFNPQAYYEGKWRNLKSLSTEGEGLPQYPDVKEYSLAQIAIPFGMGFKYSLSDKVSIGLEWTMRKTFTDYIDDVSGKYVDLNVLESQKGAIAAALSDPTGMHKEGELRGDSQTKDWYSFAGVTLTFKIQKSKKGTCDAYKRGAENAIRQMERE